MTRNIKLIVIHCSASPNGRPASIDDIDAWHIERGFSRTQLARNAFNPDLTSVGYHYVIGTDGFVYTGRHPNEVGAHAKGHNSDSIGICMIGTDEFSHAQWDALRALVTRLRITYSSPSVKGHRDLPDVHKTCPGFDVTTWLDVGMVALHGHTMRGDGIREE